MNRQLLLIDSDRESRASLSESLTNAGFQVTLAGSGAEGLRFALAVPPAAIVLDLSLSDGDGFDLCRELRQHPRTMQVPFLIASRRADEIDRILGFELGADDYIAKPCNPRELALRVKRSLLRRPPAPSAPEIVLGALRIDLTRCELWAEGRKIPLAAQEFKLLALLMQHPGVVHSRTQLLKEAWNYDSFRDSRTIDTHVRRIRLKLRRFAPYLENVRSLGYRMVVPAEILVPSDRTPAIAVHA